MEDAGASSKNNKNKHNNSNNNNKRGGRADKYIIEGDEPLDLLDRQTLAHITSTKPSAKNNNRQLSIKESSRFKKDKDGKLVIKDPEAQNDQEEDPIAKLTSGIDAYVDAIKSGPVRGQRNKLKYKRSNRAGDDNDDDDNDGDDAGAKKRLGVKKNSGTGNRGFKGAANKKVQPKRKFYN